MRRGGAGLGGVGLGGGRVMFSPVLVSEIHTREMRGSYLVLVSVVLEAAMAQVARAAARRKFSFMLKD